MKISKKLIFWDLKRYPKRKSTLGVLRNDRKGNNGFKYLREWLKNVYCLENEGGNRKGLWIICIVHDLVFYAFASVHFVLWSPAGKGLTSLLLFMINVLLSLFVMFRCGT